MENALKIVETVSKKLKKKIERALQTAYQQEARAETPFRKGRAAIDNRNNIGICGLCCGANLSKNT
jgi:hypothetical protein